MTAPTRVEGRHPGVRAYLEARASKPRHRLADEITAFAGSMPFVYVHGLAFVVWMLLVEGDPWPTLTLVVSLEAIFLSTFVLIGQNRQSALGQAKADHDFVGQELELKSNTELTREIRELLLTMDAERRGGEGRDEGPPCDRTPVSDGAMQTGRGS